MLAELTNLTKLPKSFASLMERTIDMTISDFWVLLLAFSYFVWLKSQRIRKRLFPTTVFGLRGELRVRGNDFQPNARPRMGKPPGDLPWLKYCFPLPQITDHGPGSKWSGSCWGMLLTAWGLWSA